MTGKVGLLDECANMNLGESRSFELSSPPSLVSTAALLGELNSQKPADNQGPRSFSADYKDGVLTIVCSPWHTPASW
jgi:hypothetical protein